MKKSVLIIIAVCLTAVLAFAMLGCNNVKYKAVKIEDVELEEYGFAMSKQASNKDAVMAAINEVIAELGETKIREQLTYHAIIAGGETADPAFSPVDPTTSTANGTLVMYTNAVFPPYEYSGTGGEIMGLDVDILKMAAVKLGMAFAVEDMDFDSLPVAVVSLEAGKTKIIGAGLTITEERKETLQFSDPYIVSQQYFVCAEKENYSKIADIAGKKIGVQLGTTGEFLVNDYVDTLGCTVVPYKNAALAFAALKAGKIDVVVIDQHPAESLVK